MVEDFPDMEGLQGMTTDLEGMADMDGMADMETLVDLPDMADPLDTMADMDMVDLEVVDPEARVDLAGQPMERLLFMTRGPVERMNLVECMNNLSSLRPKSLIRTSSSTMGCQKDTVAKSNDELPYRALRRYGSSA
jgi:hypothetical protein